MTANFHNASHEEFCNIQAAARAKFKTQWESRTKNESTMRWRLQQQMATQAEKQIAREWLRSRGVIR
jgi:hypothetical protein